MVIRFISLVFIFLAISGCRLLVIVPSGGTVDAGLANVSCAALTNCEFDINDSSFTEDFLAVPEPGFQFVEWYDAPGFLCGGSTDPLCVVSSVPLDGVIPDAEIADAANIYLMAVFSDKSPISETVAAADGREWAQPVLFTDLSWEDIEAVCPLGAGGVCNGSLNGWDMTGWTWGAGNDVAALLNAYNIAPPFVFPGPVISGCEAAWFSAFTADGWQQTVPSNATSLFGVRAIVAEPADPSGIISLAEIGSIDEPLVCTTSLDVAAIVAFEFMTSESQSDIGALFYRNP